MSYYRPTFSQTMAMSRGRGFSSSRSSYRGNSNRGGSAWSGSRGGGYSAARGGGGGRFSSFSGSFDSRSKYPGSSERYSGSRVHDDYRKPYRPVSINYSHADVQFDFRKPNIPDSVSGYSSRDRSPDRKRMRTESLSSRHDGGFSSSGEYGRYESSGYPERRSFSSDRRSASFSRREEFRKPPPPPSGSPRGGYRGRISSRGSLRSRLRERPARRRLIESSYVVRRRVLARSSDYARRLKMSRLRSAVVRRTKRPKLSDKGDSDEEEKEEIEEKVETMEKEEEKVEGDEDKDKSTPKKLQRNEGSPEKLDKKSDSESDEKIHKRQFIKLVCPHCQTKSATFGRYSLHLQSGRHMAAMRRVALKQKSILSRMRLAQRIAQREVEKTTDDLAPRTNFCPLCKLNYKQPKSTHQATESHKNMKKFLMPYCKTCKITFKSPMLYESHTASIEHIKRKALTSDKSDKEEGSGDEDNLENFMTIDSVGDVDEDESTEKKKEGEIKPKEQINVGIENVRKIEVYYCDLCRMYLPRAEEGELPKILAKHCRQRTHLQRYVRYKEDKDLAKHAERLQRKETAEKEKEKEKDEVKAEPDENTEKKDADSKENGELAVAEEEDAGEEKLWADVDKDLGDILAEAGSGNKSSDEDEDSVANGERYDRFKYSEKNADEKKIKAEDKTEKQSEVADEKRETDKVEEK